MWKYIPNTNNYYQVNEIGEIKSLPRLIKRGKSPYISKEKILKKQLTKNGYYQIGLTTPSGKIKPYIHQLVAEAFIPNPENKPYVDHINGDRGDNRVENLRWCTHLENSNYELHRKNLSKAKKGIKPKVNNSKIVHQIDMKTGEVIAEYKDMVEAHEKTRIHKAAISRVILHKKCTKNGYSWYTLSAGGYYWQRPIIT